jgi:hypothetical protein
MSYFDIYGETPTRTGNNLTNAVDIPPSDVTPAGIQEALSPDTPVPLRPEDAPQIPQGLIGSDTNNETTWESMFSWLPSLNSSYLMFALVFFAIIGLLYIVYIFRDVIYNAVEEVFIYFGIIEKPEPSVPAKPIPHPEPKPSKKGEKYCVVGRNENGFVCVPYTNHRDCNSKKYVRENDCVNL